MRDLTEGASEQVLAHIVSESATTAMHCLAAAERAVVEGRFNLAKVLRACAHAARLRALTAARSFGRDTQPADVLARTRDHLERNLGPPSPGLADIIRRALVSLESNRDVLESDVAQSLWGCQACGTLTEGQRPESCPECGALRFEVEWFGPFYSGTFERLSRRTPTEIAAVVEASPSRLATLLDGIGEGRLARRPSVDEWSMKEIAGHLIDTTELFCWRVRTINEAVSPPSLEGSMPPWRLLEGKAYPEVASAAIVQDFRTATRQALDLIEGTGDEGWGRSGLVAGRLITVLDLGAWLANHNIAHCAQIEALREASRSPE